MRKVDGFISKSSKQYNKIKRKRNEDMSETVE